MNISAAHIAGIIYSRAEKVALQRSAKLVMPVVLRHHSPLHLPRVFQIQNFSRC
jgi:hypothetical protein